MKRSAESSLLSGALGALRNDQAHAYAGADQHNAVRLVALLWSLSALLAAAFVPIDPPTDSELGSAGWIVAGLLIASSFVGAVRLVKRPPRGFKALLALSYTGLLQVMLLVWLSGGADSAYNLLFLFWVGSAMGVHPPRRALVFLGATVLAAAAPLLYDGWSGDAATEVAAPILLWAAIGMVMLALMVTVRSQRVSLREGEERERELARADALTGLGNRRAFDEALESETARAKRAQSTVSIVLVDVDGLKKVNDAFGHVEGDRCLVSIADAVGRSIRAGDRAYRWGGDEFAILLPDTDYAGAEVAAASLYAEVMRTCADARGRPLTVSAGIAEADADTANDELIERADMELMARKRDKVSIAES